MPGPKRRIVKPEKEKEKSSVKLVRKPVIIAPRVRSVIPTQEPRVIVPRASSESVSYGTQSHFPGQIRIPSVEPIKIDTRPIETTTDRPKMMVTNKILNAKFVPDLMNIGERLKALEEGLTVGEYSTDGQVFNTGSSLNPLVIFKKESPVSYAPRDKVIMNLWEGLGDGYDFVGIDPESKGVVFKVPESMGEEYVQESPLMLESQFHDNVRTRGVNTLEDGDIALTDAQYQKSLLENARQNINIGSQGYMIGERPAGDGWIVKSVNGVTRYFNVDPASPHYRKTFVYRPPVDQVETDRKITQGLNQANSTYAKTSRGKGLTGLKKKTKKNRATGEREEFYVDQYE